MLMPVYFVCVTGRGKGDMQACMLMLQCQLLLGNKQSESDI